jgi:hypothetical protein
MKIKIVNFGWCVCGFYYEPIKVGFLGKENTYLGWPHEQFKVYIKSLQLTPP